MKETIVTVLMPQAAATIHQEKWWGDAIIATFGNPKWKPIIVHNVFALVSDIGTFILNTTSFASGMMCNLSEWQSNYKRSFEEVVKAITSDVQIREREEEL